MNNVKECSIKNIDTTQNEKIIKDIYNKIIKKEIVINSTNDNNNSFKSNSNDLYVKSNKNHYIDKIIKNIIYKEILKNEKIFTTSNQEECLKHLTKQKYKKIGSGFFGTTYKISSTRAIKVARLQLYKLNNQLINNNHLINEIKKEYNILKKLNKTRLSPKAYKFSFCIANDDIYIMIEMDYLYKYITLEKFLKKLKQKNKSKFSTIKQQIYDKIEYMMKKLDKFGVNHNDLHLDNIMIKKNGNDYDIKFIDFGNATSEIKKNQLRDFRFNNYVFNINKIANYIYNYLIEKYNIYIIQSPNNINKLVLYDKDK